MVWKHKWHILSENANIYISFIDSSAAVGIHVPELQHEHF